MDHSATAHVRAEGFNGTFIADLLSAFLVHEQCGAELYQAVIERTKNPILKNKYQEFHKETQRHAEILTRVIEEGGGVPSYVSEMAKATKAQDTSLLQATTSFKSSDMMVMEMAMLDAVFVAESVDHDNWVGLSALAEKLPNDGLGAALRRACAEVKPQEDDHLGWATQTRLKLTEMQAKSNLVQAAGEKAEEMMAKMQEALR